MDKTQVRLPGLLTIVPVILLLSLGILVIYSSAPTLALQQGVLAGIGLLLFWFLASINFEYYQLYAKYLYIFTLVLLIIVFLLGVETRGSVRWIPLGPIHFQPSELAKPVLIVVLASFWANNLPGWKNIFKSLGIALPFIGLVFKQPDLGTALTLGAIWGTMLIASNISFFKLLVMGVISLILMPLSWFLMQDYQKSRITSFLNPTHDPLGIGYNVIQATIAVGSGELLGRGLGRGTQSRLQFLPEFRTDFIFASIAEEFGFLGSLIVLILYGLLIYECLKVVAYSRNRMGSLLILGTTGMLFFQVMVNVGMNIGLVPVTGITLPLLSFGGSSLIATLICLSFIASVERFTRR